MSNFLESYQAGKPPEVEVFETAADGVMYVGDTPEAYMTVSQAGLFTLEDMR